MPRSLNRGKHQQLWQKAVKENPNMNAEQIIETMKRIDAEIGPENTIRLTNSLR